MRRTKRPNRPTKRRSRRRLVVAIRTSHQSLLPLTPTIPTLTLPAKRARRWVRKQLRKAPKIGTRVASTTKVRRTR